MASYDLWKRNFELTKFLYSSCNLMDYKRFCLCLWLLVASLWIEHCVIFIKSFVIRWPAVHMLLVTTWAWGDICLVKSQHNHMDLALAFAFVFAYVKVGWHYCLLFVLLHSNVWCFVLRKLMKFNSENVNLILLFLFFDCLYSLSDDS